MSRVTGSAVRLLLIAAVVALASAAASAQTLYADLNGDGVHDRVDPGVRPTEIVVQLSAGHRQRRLHADSPIVRLTAFDFNRDGHVDLVATTSKPGDLAIWINHGNGHFSRRAIGHAARQRLEEGGAGASRHHRRLQQGDNGDDVASRPLLLTCDTRVPDEFSYVRRVRDRRVVHVRFQTRTLVPRGPPANQLF